LCRFFNLVNSLFEATATTSAKGGELKLATNSQGTGTAHLIQLIRKLPLIRFAHQFMKIWQENIKTAKMIKLFRKNTIRLSQRLTKKRSIASLRSPVDWSLRTNPLIKVARPPKLSWWDIVLIFEYLHSSNYGQANLKAQELIERQQLRIFSVDFEKTKETLELGLKEFRACWHSDKYSWLTQRQANKILRTLEVASMASMKITNNFMMTFENVLLEFDVYLFSSILYADFSVEAVAQRIDDDLANILQKLENSQRDLVNEKQMNATLRTQVICLWGIFIASFSRWAAWWKSRFWKREKRWGEKL
jgi:hypothetical protein